MTEWRKTGKVYEPVCLGGRYNLYEIYKLIICGKLREGSEVRWHSKWDDTYRACIIKDGALALKPRRKEQASSDVMLDEVQLWECHEWLKKHDPVTPKQLYEHAFGPVPDNWDSRRVDRLLDKMDRHGYFTSEDRYGQISAHTRSVHQPVVHGKLRARWGN